MNLFRELIDGDIGRSADEDLSLMLLDQMIDGGGGSDGFARPGRPLDQRQRALKHGLHGVHLGMIQLRQPRGRETLRQLAF